MTSKTSQEINAMAKSARPINFEPITEKSMLSKYADRVRHGKTKKDHARKHKSIGVEE